MRASEGHKMHNAHNAGDADDVAARELLRNLELKVGSFAISFVMRPRAALDRHIDE